MLQITKQLPSDETRQGIWGPSSVKPISNLTSIIRHQLPIVIASMALVTALGLLYLFTTPPTYLATASVVIDISKARSFERQQPAPSENAIDTGLVQTQIEILKSTKIAGSVVTKLRLIEDPEFVGPGTGLKGAFVKLFSALFDNAKLSDPELIGNAVAALESRRTVARAGQTYVIEIWVESLDPNKAARIANAIVDAYLKDELEAKYAAASRASVWLQERAKELQSEASGARRAVVEFKTKNNIVIVNADEKRLKGGEGRLMNDQQLSEVNSQLVLAQAATAEAKARYEQIREIVTQGLPDASVAESLKSEIIIKLREQYLDVANREAIWSQRYGPNHLAVASMRSQMLEFVRSIKEEMKKIEESANSDYEIAQSRERSIRESLSQAVSQSQMTDQARIKLDELESAAQTAQSVYDNFLERYTQAVQQQSFPITEARRIDLAEPPLSKNNPKTFLVLLITGATGLVVSICAASLREHSDRVFRSSEQVEDFLAVKCLAMLPKLQSEASSRARSGQNIKTWLAPWRVHRRPESMLSHVLNESYSQYTEAVRSMKVASDLKWGSEITKVIAFTSTLPHEGKSTTAANFAQLVAQGGCATILIDADLRNPTLSRQLAPGDTGLVDVLAGRKTIQGVTKVDQRTGLKLLLSDSKSKILSTSDLLSSAAMKKVIEELRDSYDYIIVDLPPLIPIVDARAAATLIDAYIYVVEWGRTRIDTAQYCLSNAPELYERLLGAVINKVDMTKLKRYERHMGNWYYDKYFTQYSNFEHPLQ